LKTLFLAVNLLGTLFGIPLAVLGMVQFLDPITLADAASRDTGLLLLAGLSVAGLVNRRRPWLGALGLALLVSIWTVLSWLDLGVMSDEEKNAYAAVRRNDAPALRLALDAGVSPNLYSDGLGSLLSAAVLSDDTAALKMLIDAGADVDARHGDRETPLVTAVFIGNCEAAIMLLRAGADPRERLRHPEHYAVSRAYANKTVRELYDTEIRRQSGSPPAAQSCWLRFEALLAARNG
jgi:hypothetical protein